MITINQNITGLSDQQFNRIIKLLNQIHMDQVQLAQELAALQAQVDKANGEILQKIADLEAAIAAAGNVTPEVQAALDALKASVQSVDDIVPDQV